MGQGIDRRCTCKVTTGETPRITLTGTERDLWFVATNLSFARNLRIYMRAQLQWMEHNENSGDPPPPVSFNYI